VLGIQTIVQLPPRDSPRFKPELETAIFRIIQEALTNVFRHSGAHKAWVTIATSDSQTAVMIRDDGKGLDEDVIGLRPGSVGIGLGGMRQRVKEFGGELLLQNMNPGTEVKIVIPSGSLASPSALSAPYASSGISRTTVASSPAPAGSVQEPA
jgi:signal transduction histidine kinase